MQETRATAYASRLAAGESVQSVHKAQNETSPGTQGRRVAPCSVGRHVLRPPPSSLPPHSPPPQEPCLCIKRCIISQLFPPPGIPAVLSPGSLPLRPRYIKSPSFSLVLFTVIHTTLQLELLITRPFSVRNRSPDPILSLKLKNKNGDIKLRMRGDSK